MYFFTLLFTFSFYLLPCSLNICTEISLLGYYKITHTVKSPIVAAATINSRVFLLRPQFKGGLYLGAATIDRFQNYSQYLLKLRQNGGILHYFYYF